MPRRRFPRIRTPFSRLLRDRARGDGGGRRRSPADTALPVTLNERFHVPCTLTGLPGPAMLPCLAAHLPAQADLSGEMDSLFGTLVNVTDPSAHLGQRRGVLSGGSIVSRNRITNVHPRLDRPALLRGRLRWHRSLRRLLLLHQRRAVHQSAALDRLQRGRLCLPVGADHHGPLGGGDHRAVAEEGGADQCPLSQFLPARPGAGQRRRFRPDRQALWRGEPDGGSL